MMIGWTNLPEERRQESSTNLNKKVVHKRTCPTCPRKYKESQGTKRVIPANETKFRRL